MGILLISMEWSFIFYQRCWNVLHCIFHYYCGNEFFLTFFPERTGFLFGEECRRSGEFSMAYFTMFAVCASYCVFTSPLAWASTVCSVAQPLNNTHRATRPILTAYIWIEAHYVFWGHRTPPSVHTKPGHWEAQTDINPGCKSFCELCGCSRLLSICPVQGQSMWWCLYFILGLLLVTALRCFYQLHWIYALCKW